MRRATRRRPPFEGARSEGAPITLTSPFEILAGRRDAPVFLTCEHASEALPEGYAWSARDRRLVGTHWAFDLGARDLTLELAAALEAPAVLATFSRLLVDPNRPVESETLFRRDAEGEPVELNAAIDGPERERRLSRYYQPFHDAVDRQLRENASPIVLAVHTFTPLYHGERRHLELGVLFDREETLGAAWVSFLVDCGYDCQANEPWSGKAGLIYVAQSHADRQGRRAMELEVRQDLAVDPAFRSKLVPQLVKMLGRPAP